MSELTVLESRRTYRALSHCTGYTAPSLYELDPDGILQLEEVSRFPAEAWMNLGVLCATKALKFTRGPYCLMTTKVLFNTRSEERLSRAPTIGLCSLHAWSHMTLGHSSWVSDTRGQLKGLRCHS